MGSEKRKGYSRRYQERQRKKLTEAKATLGPAEVARLNKLHLQPDRRRGTDDERFAKQMAEPAVQARIATLTATFVEQGLSPQDARELAEEQIAECVSRGDLCTF